MTVNPWDFIPGRFMVALCRSSSDAILSQPCQITHQVISFAKAYRNKLTKTTYNESYLKSQYPDTMKPFLKRQVPSSHFYLSDFHRPKKSISSIPKNKLFHISLRARAIVLSKNAIAKVPISGKMISLDQIIFFCSIIELHKENIRWKELRGMGVV